MIIRFIADTCRRWRDIVHFGIGKTQVIDTLIEWPDGNFQTFYNTKVNQVLEVKYMILRKIRMLINRCLRRVYFQEVSRLLDIKFKHKEWDKIDFYKQRTLPHKFSQAGPAIAIGDVNGDGLEDFIIGGSSLYDATIYTQKLNGSFRCLRLLRRQKKNRKMKDCCFSMPTMTKILISIWSAEVMKEMLM